jgi:hypothetical protein
VRSNFATAQTEITALQAALATAQADITALKARSQSAANQLAATPPNTNSAVLVMAGIGVTFVPEGATRAVVLLDGQLGNTNNGSASDAQMAYGLGAPPSSGVLFTTTNGTLIGSNSRMIAAKNNDSTPFSTSTLLTGLVAGQTYWIGVAFLAESGIATMSELSLTIFELINPLP